MSQKILPCFLLNPQKFGIPTISNIKMTTTLKNIPAATTMPPYHDVSIFTNSANEQRIVMRVRQLASLADKRGESIFRYKLAAKDFHDMSRESILQSFKSIQDSLKQAEPRTHMSFHVSVDMLEMQIELMW